MSPETLAAAIADFSKLYPGRRAAHVIEEATRSPQLQRLLAEAATSDAPNLMYARIAAAFEPPAMDRAAIAYGTRGMPGRRSVEQVARDGVAEELGPYFREAPMEQVNDAQSLLGPTLGGEDLVARLEGMTPRPLYALELPGDTSVRSQMDATYGPFAFPPENRGLIVQGGQGVPVGGPTGSGVIVPGPTGLSTQVTPRQRIPGPPQRRVGTTAGVPVGEVTARSSPRSAPAPEAPRRLESPDAQTERHGMEDLADAVAVDEAAARAARVEANRPGASLERARQVAEDVVRRTAIPVAAGAAGIAAWNAMQDDGAEMEPVAAAPSARTVPDITSRPQAYRAPRPMVPDVTSKPKPFSTADLAAETSPPPSVMTKEPVPISPREQAHALQKKLNDMRAAARGEVPEAAAMRQEIQRLFDMSDSQAAAAARTGVAAPGVGPLSGARRILADLNAGRIPSAQRAQAQAEMQRLYRQADEQANAMTAARRAG
jgi:hypothetical protein